MPAEGTGQVLVLMALLVGVVALLAAGLWTLGIAQSRRVALQDATDAAAYASAVQQARAFNAYATGNRLQVSRYVSAMAAQSALSFAYFTEAFLTDAYGLTKSLAPCGLGSRDAFWKVACAALEAVPGLGPVLKGISLVLEALEKGVALYQRTLRASRLDALIGRRLIPTLLALNHETAREATVAGARALAATREAAAAAASDHGVTLSEHVLREAATQASECLFDRAHVRETNGSPLAPRAPSGEPLDPRERRERSKLARAKRAMAQIANASRHGCDGDPGCTERFLTDRRLEELLPFRSLLGPLAEAASKMPKWGQTRLLSHGLAGGGESYLREPGDAPGAPMAMLAQGDNLGADDVYALGIGPRRLPLGFANPLACDARDPWEVCHGDPREGLRADRPLRSLMKTSIWALNAHEGKPGGVHWRVAYPDGYPAGTGWEPPTGSGPETRLGLSKVRRAVGHGLFVSVWVANVRPIQDGNHPWPGLAPFPHFEPGRYDEECSSGDAEARVDTEASREAAFNQPSSWVVLSGRPSPDDGSRRPPLAVARALTYYHRPGNWAEQPSFFNPYWRARLAPVRADDGGLLEHPALRERLPDVPEVLFHH